MIDPHQVAEMLATSTASLVKPVPTGGPIKPIPTVIPTPTEYQLASETGFRTLWVVFVLMVIFSIVFAGLSWNVPVQKRVFHVITTLITIIAALAYFAMASGDGVSLHCIPVKDHHDEVPDTFHDVCRQVYWGRYVDMALTTPLIILDLALLAGISGAHTVLAIAADFIMVFGGLFAAFGRERTPQRWGWYAIAIISYLFVIWHVALHGSRVVSARGNKVVKLFSTLGLFTLVVWTAYPIVWGITEGARKTSVNTEIIIYAVLDILATAVFGLWLLVSHRKIPETNVVLDGYWSHGLLAEGRIRLVDDDEA